FRALPALNLGWLEAAILIGAPVRGLRPVVAFLFAILKVPKPTMRTSFFFFRELVTAPINASTALAASALVRPEAFATSLIRSCLFTVLTPFCIKQLTAQRYKSFLDKSSVEMRFLLFFPFF